jgi:hypothetical protein
MDNDETKPLPRTLSDFGTHWACSWIEIKGGAPLGREFTPVFVNELTFFSDEGCAASVNIATGCVDEPCDPVVVAKCLKPAEFENGNSPAPLTPEMYGSNSGATARTVEPRTRPQTKITTIPMTDLTAAPTTTDSALVSTEATDSGNVTKPATPPTTISETETMNEDEARKSLDDLYLQIFRATR